METREKSSLQIAQEVKTILLNNPAYLLFDTMEDLFSGTVEAVRCENIPVGIIYNGRERLTNGTVRLHCQDQTYIIPFWQKEALAAVNDLCKMHNFEGMTTIKASQFITNWIKSNGKAITANG